MPWRESLLQQQAERRSEQLWRETQQLHSAQSVEVVRDGEIYLNFCSNDYLGLASHPALIDAAVTTAQVSGISSGASHLVCGHHRSHDLLERELSEFVGAESAILFSTGYMANLAAAQCFLGKSDLLLQDKLNHASLLDAAKHSHCDFKRYAHLNTEHAKTFLEKHLLTQPDKRRLITTDSIFSMDGDLAPIDKLNQLGKEKNAVLLIDDAHGFGVLGNKGQGSYAHFGLKPSEHRLMLGTLGKAVGSFGAFIAGDKVYIDQLRQLARTYIYTTALPMLIAETTRAALLIIESEPERRTRLQNSIQYLRTGIKALGLDLMESDSPIQPVLMGAEEKALSASEQLKSDHIWITAIRPPTVPKGSSRLRITLSSEHTTEHLDRLLSSLSQINT